MRESGKTKMEYVNEVRTRRALVCPGNYLLIKEACSSNNVAPISSLTLTMPAGYLHLKA